MSILIYEELTYKIIGAAKEVYRELGPGFLESVYDDALCYELKVLKIPFISQPELDIQYKSVIFEKNFRVDLIIDNKVLIENKAIRKLTNQNEAQLINYLKATNLRVGLLFNFGSSKFEFLRRII